MDIKEELKKIKTADECIKMMSVLLKDYTTMYSVVYSDYEEKSFTKQIKAYENNGKYIVMVSELNNMKVSEVTVYLTNTKPKKPHPVFPIMESFVVNPLIYTFA